MADTRLFDAISSWNYWGREPIPAGTDRTILPSLAPWLQRPEVLAICGMRRCGKTTLMRQLGRYLLREGARPTDLLFVNLEDPVFLEGPADARVLERLFDTYQETMKPGARPYVFLDEVQNLDGWARWVRAQAERRAAHLVVSGSSSKLLEPEVATVLTGRSFTQTLWPLSFREVLRFRGIDAGPAAAIAGHGPRIRQELVDYLRWGGLPEVVLAAEPTIKAALLKQYFRDILFRDVVARHQVRSVRALEQVAHHFLVNTANLSTYNRLKNTYGLAMDQVRAYTDHLEESYLIRSVPVYSPKVSAQARAPRKVYAVDVGLRNAVAFHFSQDVGRLAETVVHAHLVRDEDVRLFYWKERAECDFVVWQGGRATRAIQVCYESMGELPEREVKGLLEPMTRLDIAEGIVVTNEVAFEREVDGRRITAVPLWRWLQDV
jgi:hypothetical protein